MTDAVGPPQRRPGDAGPSLPLVAGVSTALFLAGVLVPLVMGGDPYPSPLGGRADVPAYVAEHADALRVAAVLHFASSVPLAVFTASIVARLHVLGVRAAGPTIALTGGVLASAALALSGCAHWVLSRAPEDSPPALLGALHDLTFLAGGPWHVVALGLLLAGVAVPAAFYQLLPRSVWVPGLILAVVCELSTFVLLFDGAAHLLPVGRFGGLAWLIVAGFALPKARSRKR